MKTRPHTLHVELHLDRGMAGLVRHALTHLLPRARRWAAYADIEIGRAELIEDPDRNQGSN